MMLHKTAHLQFEFIPEAKAILVTATHKFIPGADFKAAFETLLNKLDGLGATRMVFDKRELTVFDQQAMTWYHLDWKPRAYAAGITRHVKLLPQNEVFRKSVEIGKLRIQREHPEFDYAKYQISYSESLEEALAAPVA
jgi:hypothetical protein